MQNHIYFSPSLCLLFTPFFFICVHHFRNSVSPPLSFHLLPHKNIYLKLLLFHSFFFRFNFLFQSFFFFLYFLKLFIYWNIYYLNLVTFLIYLFLLYGLKNKKNVIFITVPPHPSYFSIILYLSSLFLLGRVFLFSSDMKIFERFLLLFLNLSLAYSSNFSFYFLKVSCLLLAAFLFFFIFLCPWVFLSLQVLK